MVERARFRALLLGDLEGDILDLDLDRFSGAPEWRLQSDERWT
jgi:hypothetical protein